MRRPGGAGGAADTDQHQDEVISYLVHELRSPLTAVAGFAQMLRHSPGDAASSEYGRQAVVASTLVQAARGGEPLDQALTDAIEEIVPDPDALHGLVRAALDDARSQVEALADAVADADRGRVARHAHALAGALGSYGAHLVQVRCQALEEAASSDPAQLEAAFEQVRDAVRDAEQALLARFPGGRR